MNPVIRQRRILHVDLSGTLRRARSVRALRLGIGRDLRCLRQLRRRAGCSNRHAKNGRSSHGSREGHYRFPYHGQTTPVARDADGIADFAWFGNRSRPNLVDLVAAAPPEMPFAVLLGGEAASNRHLHDRA